MPGRVIVAVATFCCLAGQCLGVPTLTWDFEDGPQGWREPLNRHIWESGYLIIPAPAATISSDQSVVILASVELELDPPFSLKEYWGGTLSFDINVP